MASPAETLVTAPEPYLAFVVMLCPKPICVLPSPGEGLCVAKPLVFGAV